MRHNSRTGFVDLQPFSFLTHVNRVIRAAETQQVQQFRRDADLFNLGFNRRCFYVEDDDTRYYLEMVPYVHPTGAADLVIGTVAWSGNTRAFTPSNEGLLLSETGVLVPIAGAPQDAIDVAGAMLSDYVYHHDDDFNSKANYAVTTITEGDMLWVARKGDIELDSSTAVTAGEALVSSTTVAGEVEAATAIDTTGTIAAYHATLIEQTVNQPLMKGLAVAKDTIAAAGTVKAWLDLPSRYER